MPVLKWLTIFVFTNQGNDKIKEIINANESQIKADVLADEVILDKLEGYTADWKINGEAVTLGVTKVEA